LTIEPGAGLRKTCVFSGDEDEDQLASDLDGLKGSYLISEELRLASARLYYTLLAMRGPANKHLRKEFSDLEDKIGLANIADPKELGLSTINDFLLSERNVLALREIASGFRQGAFTILPYDDVVQAMCDLMLGKWKWMGIPMFDQSTFEVLDSFYKISLQGSNPNAKGLVDPGSRKRSSYAWAANKLLSNTPAFPHASWPELFEMREHLRPGRRPFLKAMRKLVDKFDEDTPVGITEGLAEWEDDINDELEEVEDFFSSVKRLPYWRKFLGDGGGTAMLGLGVAAVHPHWAVGGLGLAIASFGQLLLKETNERSEKKYEKERDVKTMPYWFLYEMRNWQA